MTNCVDRPCWQIWVWHGHWQVRASYDTPEAARLSMLIHRRREPRVRLRLVRASRRVATYSQPHAPTAARQFRESQAAKMQVLRQALTYYKSGSNGTEIPSLPREAVRDTAGGQR